jgi:hypothetical protein
MIHKMLLSMILDCKRIVYRGVGRLIAMEK